MELDHSGFTSQYPTVFAGNLGNGKYILQVVVVTFGLKYLKDLISYLAIFFQSR